MPPRARAARRTSAAELAPQRRAQRPSRRCDPHLADPDADRPGAPTAAQSTAAQSTAAQSTAAQSTAVQSAAAAAARGGAAANPSPAATNRGAAATNRGAAATNRGAARRPARPAAGLPGSEDGEEFAVVREEPLAHARPARARDEAIQLARLLVGSPREVLARIVPGDPLGVRDVVAEVLRSDCLFLDADRVHLRALARIARAALRFGGSGLELAAWLRVEASVAVTEILREETEAPRAEPNSAFVQFARPLGLDPEALRRGCAAFHRLPRADRAAFFALLVHNVGLEAHARSTGETPSELGRRARRGLDAVLHANHPVLSPAMRPVAAVPIPPERTEKTR